MHWIFIQSLTVTGSFRRAMRHIQQAVPNRSAAERGRDCLKLMHLLHHIDVRVVIAHRVLHHFREPGTTLTRNLRPPLFLSSEPTERAQRGEKESASSPLEAGHGLTASQSEGLGCSLCPLSKPSRPVDHAREHDGVLKHQKMAAKQKASVP